MERPDQDEELFARYRDEGAVDAIGELFDRTAPELLRMALHLSGRLDEAEDLVQETFLTALTERHRYRAQGRFRGWLAAILENRAKRLFRRRRRDGRQAGLDAAQGVATDAPTAPELSARREDITLLAQRIKDLGEPYATVVGLKLRHGLGATEIAKMLDRSADTVQSQLRRGMERLKNALPTGFALGAAITPRLDLQRAIVLGQAKALAPAVVVGGSGVLTGASAGLRVAALVLLALGGAVFGWAQWSTDGEQPAGGAARVANERTLTTTEGATTVESPPARIALAQPAGPHRLDPAQLPPMDYGFDWGPPVRIRVVDDGSGEPVPGATVRLQRPGSWPYRDLSERDWNSSTRRRHRDLEAYYASGSERLGTSLTTDADGYVEMPWRVASNPWMTARHGERYGERHRATQRVIRIARDRDFVVRVEDPNGRPVAGLPLLLYGVQTPQRYDIDDSRRALSDEDGRAVFRHAGLLADTLRARGIGQCRVLVNAPLPDGCGLELATERLLREDPMPFTVPETGSLRLRLLDTDGEPFPVKGGRIGISVAGRQRAWGLDPVDSPHHTVHFLPTASATAPRLVAETYGVLELELPRPVAGRVQDVDVVLGRQGTLFRGRLVDAHLQPLPRVMFRLVRPDGRLGWTEYETDTEGRFAVPRADFDDEDDERPGFVALQVESGQRYPGGTLDVHWPGPLRAPIDLTVSRAGGVVQLGDLVLHPQPVVAQGRLLVSVPEDLEPLLEKVLTTEHPLLRVDVRRTDEFGSTEWVEARAASVEIRADGWFTVRHEMPGAHDYRLRGRKRFIGKSITLLPTAPVVCTPGTRGLQIEMKAGAALSIELPPELFDDETVRLRCTPRPEVWPEHDSRDPDAETRGEWDRRLVEPPSRELFGRGLWPGRYRVELANGEGGKNVLATWGDLELVTGACTQLDYASAAVR